MEIINFSAELTASDTERRIIGGQIVPFEKIGSTNIGKVVFEKGSITIDPSKRQKLLLEHDPKAPLGYLKKDTIKITDEGIYAEFKLSNTQRGNDALIEASDEWQLRNGLSVGVEVVAGKNKNGVYHVSAANLYEVSLVQAAAFGNENAGVSKVAASENTEADSTETKTEIEELVENTTPESVATEVVETPAVEASRPTVTAAIYAAPRIELSKEKYLENSIRAKLGDENARQYLLAAAATTTNNAGLVPTRQLTEVINPLANADRPFISAISSGVLPDAGLTFEIPKISQVPTVAVTTEGGTPSDTALEDSYLSVAIQKFAGQQTFSLEILDRSSPAFFAELVKNMEYAYAKATDARVAAVIGAAATDGGNRTMSAANLLDFVTDAAVSVYSGTLGFAQNIVMSPQQWGEVMGLLDTTNRAIYTAANPVNNGGTANPTSLQGNINGLNLYVSRSLSGTGDGTIIAINPDSYTWYESSQFRLESNLISTGQVQVGYFGYGAIATKVAAGAYKWMVA